MFKRTKTGLPVLKIKYIAKKTSVDYEDIAALFHSMLLYVLSELMILLKVWVKTKVPKATGQLRQSLLDNLESSYVKKGLMRIVLGTHLNYAPKVAEYTTEQVRHDQEVGYAYYYKSHGRIILHDPEAIGNFWEEMIKYAHERTRFLLRHAIDKYFKGTGKLMKSVRGEL